MQSFENNNNNGTSQEESNKKVHVKVQLGNEKRRFSVDAGSYSFASFVQYIKRLFHVNSDIELKYKDDEDDMIIISSDEELKFAIELFSETHSLLRLIVEVRSSNVPATGYAVALVGNGCGFGGKRKCGRFNSEGHQQPHCGRGQWKGHNDREQSKRAFLNFKIEKLSKKRDELSEKLKSFGAPAPRLEAKIACINDKIKRLTELAAVPQQNLPHYPIHQHHRNFSDSESSSEGKWGRRGCGKWKGANLNDKIERLTQKRNFLSHKLKQKDAPAPHLEAKIARIDTWITKLKEFASSVPQENTHHHYKPHSVVPPCGKMGDSSSESESSSEGKGRKGKRRCGKDQCGRKRGQWANDPICMRMWELRKEKKELKRLLCEGPESGKEAATDRIVAIMNELAQLRQKKRAEKQ